MVPWIWFFCGLSFQLSFEVISAPLAPWSSITGSLRSDAAGRPELVSEGPMPRNTTGLATLPVMMKPPIITLSPVSTRTRVERLRVCDGVVGTGSAMADARLFTMERLTIAHRIIAVPETTSCQTLQGRLTVLNPLSLFTELGDRAQRSFSPECFRG